MSADLVRLVSNLGVAVPVVYYGDYDSHTEYSSKRFRPQEDITAPELAACVAILLTQLDEDWSGDPLHGFPDSVVRHFD